MSLIYGYVLEMLAFFLLTQIINLLCVMHIKLHKYGGYFCAYRSVGQWLYNTTLYGMLGNIVVTKSKQSYVNLYFL